KETARASLLEPLSGRRAKDAYIGFAVTIKITRRRDIGRGAEGSPGETCGALEQVPCAVTINRRVRLSIAIIIAGNYLVGRYSKVDSRETRSAPQHVPVALRRPEHGNIRLSIAVIIARDRLITAKSKLRGDNGSASARLYKPGAGRRP